MAPLVTIVVCAVIGFTIHNDPSTGLQGTIVDLLDRKFMDSQAIAIRRLADQPKTSKF